MMFVIFEALSVLRLIQLHRVRLTLGRLGEEIPPFEPSAEAVTGTDLPTSEIGVHYEAFSREDEREQRKAL